MGLQPLACWDCGFKSRQGHGCLSVVSVVCLSDRGLCDGLNPRPEESYQVCRVIVCDLETSWMWRLKRASESWKPVKEEDSFSDINLISLSRTDVHTHTHRGKVQWLTLLSHSTLSTSGKNTWNKKCAVTIVSACSLHSKNMKRTCWKIKLKYNRHPHTFPQTKL